jgi:hypothetical protein
MPKSSKPNLGSLRRRFTTLLTALTFIVLTVSGVLAFVRPFSITIVGLHALIGFLVTLLVSLHVANNIRPLKGYLRSRTLWVTLAITTTLTGILLIQPRPVKSILSLSGNLGPALERFEIEDDGMVFHYSPAPEYRMKLTLKTGSAFDPENPPHLAIWLENQSLYHIKTLLGSDDADCENQLPYWSFKVREYTKAKKGADEGIQIDAVSSPTQNSSFDPADYILPADIENPRPYRLVVEINQENDTYESIADQPSLIYAVEIDNLHPRSFQLLDLMGYPKCEENDAEENWAVYFVDEGVGSALQLIDSGLLEIDRN